MPDMDQVLRDEANQIHANAKIPDGVCGTDLKIRLTKLATSAICLSGGGIRSAAFSLGIVQALAAYPPSSKSIGSDQRAAAAKASMLAQFHYLSTVSGGGYTGSFLSAWLSRTSFVKVWQGLVGRFEPNQDEAPTLRWLRSYTNYLTPKLGLTSGDTWAALALSTRNLLLNWAIILPMLCAVIVAFKIFALLSDWLTRRTDLAGTQFGVGLTGMGLLVLTLALITHNRPTRQFEESNGLTQRGFVFGPLLLSALSALVVMQFLSANTMGDVLLQCEAGHSTSLISLPNFTLPICDDEFLSDPVGNLLQPGYPEPRYVCAGAAIGVVLFGLGWLLGWPRQRSLADFGLWALSGSVYGALIGFWLYFYIQIPDDGIWIFSSVVLHLVFGVPWMLLAELVAFGMFVGLSSYETGSDADREWFGRAAGYILALTIGWFVVNFLVYFGVVLKPLLFKMMSPDHVRTVIPIVGTVSGLITAYLGKSSSLPRKEGRGSLWSAVGNIVLGIAAFLFASATIIIASYLLDQIILGETLIPEQFKAFTDDPAKRTNALVSLAIAFAVLLVVGSVASWAININRFSLHAIYRNRLIRGFLGASHTMRAQNPLTGFDTTDNPPVHSLWPAADPNDWRPFHVINMALNVVSSSNLAWQERKAESFTVTPLHSGSAGLGFQDSRRYGDPAGITLGTAMAISGAAVSPNMGYHSSPGITFLMTMFNVRLGWWLCNPGPKGNNYYHKEGPSFAILPLVQEALGLTTDERRFVYLSDGGHFEDLGLYEMIRRRCRFILVSDAGSDPEFSFEDLGNAIRKVSIDFGVPIRFHKLEDLKRRPLDGTDLGANHVYHAMGEIEYSSVDGDVQNGIILYVKAGYHGVESAGIRSYAMANPDFPHQSTIDQWFTESQFESYRLLGFEIMTGILKRAESDAEFKKSPSIQGMFAALLRGAGETVNAQDGQQDLATA